MITFDSVSMVYAGQTHPALMNVSVDIDDGEFVFLVGPSGSGKSTFIRLILGEQRPSRGRLMVNGRNVGRMSRRRVASLRRGIGTVFQDFQLLPGKTVYENVAFALEVIGKSVRCIRDEVPRTLELVGLADKGDRMPGELSGGEQQRVAIARAVVNHPGILIADEPTGNLDPETSIGIMKLLDRIHRSGTTVLMATHDATIVDQMRRRVLELDHGHLVRDQKAGLYGTQ